MINVTKPFLPPIEEYFDYVRGIYKRNWLTNNGPLVNELELKLKEYLDVPHLLYLSNGTIALEIAMRALDLKGDVITTPFSYVASTSSIVWHGCTPVFTDIDPETLNIDATKIEAAITPATTGILATHVYGNPCDVEAIDRIAKKHHLKVIYDGAHCFGTTYNGKSIYTYGDVTTASFHATKIFHTGEGGAVITKDPELTKKMAMMRNFGHNGPEDFAELGINGKNSEFHAAIGLANLRHIDAILEKMKAHSGYYHLKTTGLRVTRPRIVTDIYNHSYYPVIFETEEALLKATAELQSNWINPRRYFYPSLHKLKYVNYRPMPVTEDVSRRVLCLPLYFDLSNEEIDFITRLLLRAQNN